MPPTPIHFFSIAPLHFIKSGTFDITALLLSSTCIDLELLFFILNGQPLYHGFSHSYFFALTFFPVMISLVVFVAERKFPEILKSTYKFFRFSPTELKYSFKSIFLSSLIGGVSHIFFDMWTHRVSSYLFYPFVVFSSENPFWIGEYEVLIYVIVAFLSICSIYFWIKRMRTHKHTR
ncbi:MAG: DUF4184 family protein [Candidatus Bathyarchaeota archaeon]|nr:MAG: DUF4184 family protein [Candidatus Bathyarchaeota archaeon]